MVTPHQLEARYTLFGPSCFASCGCRWNIGSAEAWNLLTRGLLGKIFPNVINVTMGPHFTLLGNNSTEEFPPTTNLGYIVFKVQEMFVGNRG